MDAKDFFAIGAYLSTLIYADRGGPQPKENGKRARYENFEFGPYSARFGILGEIESKPLSSHDLIFELDLGSHRVSAARYNDWDEYGCRKHRIEWVDEPSDADLVVVRLLS